MARQRAFFQLDEMGADGVVVTHDCEPFKAALRDAMVPPAPVCALWKYGPDGRLDAEVGDYASRL
jgi:hypothetical protein